MYELLYKMYKESVYKSPWLNSVKMIQEDCGFPGIQVYGKVKSSLVVKNDSNNKSNKDYSISLNKNGQQKSNKVASVLKQNV